MKMDKSVQITGMIVLGVIILALIVINSSGISSKNTISVSGTATVEVMPDLVGVYFNVDSQGTTANEAGDKNSQIVANLKESLIALGFEEKNIQTQSYSIYPDYNYETNTIKGYRATHAIKVEIPANQTSKIGSVVDAGLDAGAGVGYLNFELSQESQNKYKAEAMKLAAQDATAKAEGVAEGLGKNLGSLVSVSINDYSYVPWLAYDAAGASSSAVKEAATSITPGEQEVSATVTAVFKMR